MVKIKYNLTGSKRKALSKALSEATGAEITYLGVPSYGYQVGSYVVDKTGTIVSKQPLSQDDIDQLTEKLEVAGFHPVSVELEDSPETDEDKEELTSGMPTETVLTDADGSEPSELDVEEQLAPSSAESSDTEETSSEPSETTDDASPESALEALSESAETDPEPNPQGMTDTTLIAETAEAAEASTGEISDADTLEDVTDLSDADPELKEQIKRLSAELAEMEFASSQPVAQDFDQPAEPSSSNEPVAETPEQVKPDTPSRTPMEYGSVISFTFPENVLDFAGWSRFESLKLSKYSLLKKSLKMDDLPTIKADGTVSFPWCVYDGNPERVNSTAQLLEAMINMAKNARYISPVEKPTDNEKFSMRIFMVRLNLKGEKYKTARRILMENLSGNSAWKTGKPPQKDDKPMDTPSSEELPLNCQITANKPDISPEVPVAQNN